jgi:hypothetical protein
MRSCTARCSCGSASGLRAPIQRRNRRERNAPRPGRLNGCRHKGDCVACRRNPPLPGPGRCGQGDLLFRRPSRPSCTLAQGQALGTGLRSGGTAGWCARRRGQRGRVVPVDSAAERAGLRAAEALRCTGLCAALRHDGDANRALRRGRLGQLAERSACRAWAVAGCGGSQHSDTAHCDADDRRPHRPARPGTDPRCAAGPALGIPGHRFGQLTAAGPRQLVVGVHCRNKAVAAGHRPLTGSAQAYRAARCAR